MALWPGKDHLRIVSRDEIEKSRKIVESGGVRPEECCRPIAPLSKSVTAGTKRGFVEPAARDEDCGNVAGAVRRRSVQFGRGGNVGFHAWQILSQRCAALSRCRLGTKYAAALRPAGAGSGQA